MERGCCNQLISINVEAMYVMFEIYPFRNCLIHTQITKCKLLQRTTPPDDITTCWSINSSDEILNAMKLAFNLKQQRLESIVEEAKSEMEDHFAMPGLTMVCVTFCV